MREANPVERINNKDTEKVNSDIYLRVLESNSDWAYSTNDKRRCLVEWRMGRIIPYFWIFHFDQCALNEYTHLP